MHDIPSCKSSQIGQPCSRNPQGTFGLIGRTLGHSYSPQIHQCLADYEYRLVELEPDQVEDFVRNGDFDGFNVTIPYKVTVAGLCDVLSDAARRIGCVNTVIRLCDGTLYGDNTDYYGFRYMMESAGMDVTGAKVVVLGAGGASKTAQVALGDMGAASVVVLSRSIEGFTLQDASAHADASFIVNTTPVGMYPHCPESPIQIEEFTRVGETRLGWADGLKGVADVVYNPARTGLMLQCERLGVPHVNGLSMLVGQAKRACELFSGQPVDDAQITRITHRIAAQEENVVLIGMPGCGKSTIGVELAQALGREYVDADQRIQEAAGKPIPQIFQESGEAGFRALETQVMAELGSQSGLVIGCGGGVITQPVNYDLLHQNGVLLRVRRPLEHLDTQGRPLSASEGVGALYTQRKHLYEAWADLTIDNDDTPQVALDRCMRELALWWGRESLGSICAQVAAEGPSHLPRTYLVINGPNINMLGIREPAIYGNEGYAALLTLLEETSRTYGFMVEEYQSNHEGDLVDRIQQAMGCVDGIVINPGAYTHTSVALLDALKAVQIPFVEVHISDVSSREDFRQVSYVRQAAITTITGQGIDGYRQGLLFLNDFLVSESCGWV